MHVVARDVGGLVLFEPFAIQVDAPEAFYILRNGRVDSIVVRHGAVRLIGGLLEVVSDAVEVSLQLLVAQPLQVRFHVFGNRLDLLLGIVQVRVEVLSARFAKLVQHLLRAAHSNFPDCNDAEDGRDNHREEDCANRHECYLRAN